MEYVVLVNHGTFSGSYVFADFKNTFIRHRDIALAHILQHILQAFAQTFTFGFEGFFLGIRVERQKIAGGHGRYPLLDCKANALAGFFIRLHGFGHAHECVRIERIRCRRKRRQRVLRPVFTGKTPVFRHLRGLRKPSTPQLAGLCNITLL